MGRQNRLLILVVVIALAIAAVPAVVSAAGGTFVDDDTSIFEADIEWMAGSGVTKGCDSAKGLFCPEDNVTRGQMAAFMKRFAGFLGAEDGVVNAADSATNAGHATTAGSATTAGDSDTVDGKHAAAFLGRIEKAADSNLLDGYDSNDLRTVVAGDTTSIYSPTPGGVAVPISPTLTPVVSVDLVAPAAGFVILSFTGFGFDIPAIASTLMTWVQPGAICFDPMALIPGTLSIVKFTPLLTFATLASGTTIPVAAGTHRFTACATSGTESNELIEASLTALWVPEGSATIASTSGLERPVPSLEDLLGSGG